MMRFLPLLAASWFLATSTVAWFAGDYIRANIASALMLCFGLIWMTLDLGGRVRKLEQERDQVSDEGDR